jgi:uncharacterized protein
VAAPYVLPYLVFALLTQNADWAPAWRAEIYLLKIVVVAALLWGCRREYGDLRVRWSPALPVAALVGVLVIVAWVGLDPYYPQSVAEWQALSSTGLQVFAHADKHAGQFDPTHTALLPVAVAVVIRVLGAVLVVPVFEELFWRGWLIRWLVNDNHRAVRVGLYTPASFAITTLAFGLTHHEWLAGIICGAAFNALLYWRRDLFACVVAHAAANLALAAWVLSKGAWWFW